MASRTIVLYIVELINKIKEAGCFQLMYTRTVQFVHLKLSVFFTCQTAGFVLYF